MLEQINLEAFGAFGAVVAILIWLLLYFKRKNENLEQKVDEIVKERHRSQEKQLEVLETTNEMLNKLLSEKEDGA